MILCPECGAKNTDKSCGQCGFAPESIDGFVAWAPELAKHNDGFPKEGFQKLANIEAGSWWFRARNKIVLWVLRKYVARFETLLEVGCGTGFVLTAIKEEFPHVKAVGSEIYTAGLRFAANRLPDVELIQADARRLPYESEFDIVVACDVLEHISEDEVVLQNFHRSLKAGGHCLITVPQHQWLWSEVDEIACHKRRYSENELRIKVESAGFQILRSTSFVSFLLPLMLVVRAKRDTNGSRELVLNPVLDRALELIMSAEYFFIRCGLSFPFGGSRLVICQRI